MNKRINISKTYGNRAFRNLPQRYTGCLLENNDKWILLSETDRNHAWEFATYADAMNFLGYDAKYCGTK